MTDITINFDRVLAWTQAILVGWLAAIAVGSTIGERWVISAFLFGAWTFLQLRRIVHIEYNPDRDRTELVIDTGDRSLRDELHAARSWVSRRIARFR